MKLRTSDNNYVEYPVKQTTHTVTFMRHGLRFGYLGDAQRYPCSYNLRAHKLKYNSGQCSKEAFNLDFKYSYYFAVRMS